MAAINDEEPTVVADRDAVDGVELVRAGVLRILRSLSPVLDELPVLVELRDPLPAVAVADEKSAVGEPRDVRRAIEELASVPASLSLGPERERDLSVVSEFVDHVELIVDHPDMLFRIVRAHLDLVRSPAAGRLEELVVLRPVLNLVPLGVDHEENMMVATLPSPALLRSTSGIHPVIVARRRSARLEEGVRSPWPSTFGERELPAHGDPDPVRTLGVDASHRSPGPAGVLHPVRFVGQRLRPVQHRLIVAEQLLTSSLLRESRRDEKSHSNQ